jgi:ClpP class serine protease
MAHQLFKFTQKLYGIPHLVNRQSFEAIEIYLAKRNRMIPMMPDGGVNMDDMNEQDEAPDDLDDIDGVGIINITGPLTYKTTGFEALCGGCSYEMILEQADDLIEMGATSIVMVFDSGGGEAYGCFESANTLRSMCDAANVPLYAYVDGMCASAAYGLACVADEIVMNQYADVGSVGVLVALMDSSKNMEQEGYKPIFISAGKQKIPYAEDGSFTKSFLSDLQTKVDSLYNAFCQHVSDNTGLSVQEVKDTEAKTFMASDALSLGLVNQVMTNQQFVDYIVTKQGASNA